MIYEKSAAYADYLKEPELQEGIINFEMGKVPAINDKSFSRN